ncbi:hypothetical protein TNCV_4839801 [Trichonephila clavipes]|nr:hypothetical protein TNCV_4839801 [Trichonephila clavipes]
MNLVILNHGQVTRTTPESEPLLTSTPYEWEDVSASTDSATRATEDPPCGGGPMHVKYVEAPGPSVGVVWKLEVCSASSGFALVT